MKRRVLKAFILLLVVPQLAQAHVFRLYAGTNEEMKEWVVISLMRSGLTVDYRGEYHGQLAPHIRLMMDADRDGVISKEELLGFIDDYKREWNQRVVKENLNINQSAYHLQFGGSTFSNLEKAKTGDPIFMTMRFRTENLKIDNPNPQKEYNLEVTQRLLFQFGQQFIEMAKARATFSNEQENAIVRFCQTAINAADKIYFTQSYPGYINRRKNAVSGIFFDDAGMRIQFLPYPKISVTFVIPDE